MAPQAIALLVVAGLMHATWNVLAKRSGDKQSFLWLALIVVVALGALPAAVLAAQTRIPAAGWALIALSGALETAYFLLLARAYTRADLSLVYPLARGAAPLFATFGAALFLGERVSGPGLAGIGAIVAGIYTVHLRGFGGRALLAPLAALGDPASRLALLIGLTIAGYSVVDKAGVGYVPPVLYIYLVFLVAAGGLTPYLLTTRRPQLAAEWRAQWAVIPLVAVLNLGAYLLVLFTMTLSPVSYVSAVRELSVLFAALLGTLVLREPFGPQKLLGAACIFAGILCIALGR